ncbi:hypothetical protein ABZ686_18450 [Streptomyces sp. NPDC006992]|uniref:hypothetical protein n=1 Tax=unclassified Streptomyces TaxID=2593676 RepID=UPI0033F28858
MNDGPQVPDCQDCAWFRTMIRRAAWDPQPRADLEALFAAHLRRKHGSGDGEGGGDMGGGPGLRSV